MSNAQNLLRKLSEEDYEDTEMKKCEAKSCSHWKEGNYCELEEITINANHECAQYMKKGA